MENNSLPSNTQCIKWYKISYFCPWFGINLFLKNTGTPPKEHTDKKTTPPDSLGVAKAGFFQEPRKKDLSEMPGEVLMCSGRKVRGRQSIPSSEVRRGSSVDSGLDAHVWEQIPGRTQRENGGLGNSHVRYFKTCLVHLLSLPKALLKGPLEPNFH